MQNFKSYQENLIMYSGAALVTNVIQRVEVLYDRTCSHDM